MTEGKRQNSTLYLLISDLNFKSEVTRFDGCTGSLDSRVQENQTSGLHFAQLSNSNGSLLWVGEVRLATEGDSFELLVRSSTEPDEDLKWSELPKVLSVFDGGYRALPQRESEKLLSDLIDFHKLVSCRVHFQNGDQYRYLSGQFTEQENLKKLTEILIQLPDSDASTGLKKSAVCIVELELFEITYFLISTLEDNEDDLFVFRLTSHFYGHGKREGRRIPLASMEIFVPEGQVLEVSDFGIKLGSLKEEISIGQKCSVSINDFPINFECVFSRDGLAGLKLIDFSASARKVWQHFLLPHQYPNLVPRQRAQHESAWEIFDRSGYFNLPNGVGDLVARNKFEVLKEWSRVDESGPEQGTAALSTDGKTFTGTIGVNRVGQNVWLSQALAASKDPKHLAHTRSLYAWRSRAIIQQIDGAWNLAFFSSEKAFLDRFFRKFLLELSEEELPYASWEEKQHYFLIPTSKSGATSSDEKSSPRPVSKLLSELLPIQGGVVRREEYFGSEFILTPPHLSLAQMLISQWSTSFESSKTRAFSDKILSEGHTFASLFLDSPIQEKSALTSESYEVVGGHRVVVWMCSRSLFPKFLANSLRAFELMNMKYGMREVA